MGQLSALQGETASDAVADYFLRKRVVVDYEAAVAGVLALDAARDSLRGVAAQLESIDQVGMSYCRGQLKRHQGRHSVGYTDGVHKGYSRCAVGNYRQGFCKLRRFIGSYRNNHANSVILSVLLAFIRFVWYN